MLTVDDIRIYLRDRPEYNRLLEKEEFSADQVRLAMNLATADFNEIPPMTNYTPEDMPFSGVLLDGTLYHLLRGGGLARFRNKLDYATNGVQINDEAPAQPYLEMANALQQRFLTNSKQLKIALNLQFGWGHVGSEYGYIYKFRDIKPRMT